MTSKSNKKPRQLVLINIKANIVKALLAKVAFSEKAQKKEKILQIEKYKGARPGVLRQAFGWLKACRSLNPGEDVRARLQPAGLLPDCGPVVIDLVNAAIIRVQLLPRYACRTKMS